MIKEPNKVIIMYLVLVIKGHDELGVNLQLW